MEGGGEEKKRKGKQERSCIATTNEPSWNGPPKSRETWRRNAVTGKLAVATATTTMSASSSPVDSDDFLLSSSSTTLPISLRRFYLRILLYSGLVPRARLIPLKRLRFQSDSYLNFLAWSTERPTPCNISFFLISSLTRKAGDGRRPTWWNKFTDEGTTSRRRSSVLYLGQSYSVKKWLNRQLSAHLVIT